MCRTSKKAMQAERENPAVLYLFDEEQMPLRQDLVDAVKHGRHVCTGARLLENDKLCLRLVELLMHGVGLKRIARALHVSKQSVRAAREALVARNEVYPLKQRVVALYEEIIECGSRSYLSDLEDGLVATSTKPIGVGIFADKRSAALGEATRIGLDAQTPSELASVTLDRLRAWVLSFPGSANSPSESAKQLTAGNGKSWL